MEKKIKNWILFAIKEFSRRGWTHSQKLFENRPEFISDDFSLFTKHLIDLKKEGLIELNEKILAPHYRLTKKGKKVQRKSVREMGQIQYMSLIKTIPQRELDYRIKIIEAFLGSLILMIIFLGALYFLDVYKITSNILIIPAMFFFFSFFMFSLFAMASLVFNFLYSLIRILSKSLWELIEPHKKIVGIIFVILFLLGGLWILVSLTKYDWADVFFNLIIAIIGGGGWFLIRNKLKKKGNSK